MRRHFRYLILTVGLTVMAGCQMQQYGEDLFKRPSKDASITASIHENMLHNENLSTLNIHVETNKRVVLLSGYVKTIRQSDTLEELATKTPGVKSVQNDLIVRK